MSTKGYVLITGASGALGRPISQYLAAQGWNLVLTSRDEDKARAMAEELRQIGSPSAHGFSFDLSDPQSPQDLVDRLASKGLMIEHLVNNARSLDTLKVEKDGTPTRDSFFGELENDVVQPYYLTMKLAHDPRHALRSVVNIGSQYGVVAPNPALYGGSLSESPIQYGVAKAALHHLTREMAARLAPNVRVNCVAFGGFSGRASEALERRYSEMVPAARMLRGAEAAGPVAFLLSDESSAVNGHVLVADGGWSIW